jgi:hypothetical protein
MSTPQQIEANRQNAQLSTGPKTDEGKQRSSQNATRHGFTGQTLIITDAEKEAYEAHVQGFYAEYSPACHVETNLVQQLADLHWSIQQIFVQQCNLISLMNAISVQLAPAGDPVAAAPPPTSKSASNFSARKNSKPNAKISQTLPNTTSYSKQKANRGSQPILASFVPWTT